MAINNLYDTKTLLELVEVNRNPTTFLMNMFFSDMQIHESKTIEFDTVKDRRRVAAYVSRSAEGNNVSKTGYTTNSFIAPYTKPKKVITVDDMLKRAAGQINYVGSGSAMERAAMLIGREYNDLDNIITRSEELQAMQAAFDGVVNVQDENGATIANINFNRDAGNTVVLAGGDLWDQLTANILENIRSWKRLIQINGGELPDRIVMGWEAVDAFLADDEVKSMLDNRRMPNSNQIAMEAREMGAVYVGQLEGLEIYSYDGVYQPLAGGPEQYYVDPKTVLIGKSSAGTRHYGVCEWITDESLELFATPRLPVSWVEKDPSQRFLQVHSAHLIVPRIPDMFLKATVLT